MKTYLLLAVVFLGGIWTYFHFSSGPTYTVDYSTQVKPIINKSVSHAMVA